MEIIEKYFSGLTEWQMQQFRNLGALYSSWNTKINVISRKDIDQLYEKHILHSLSIARAGIIKKGMNIIDIGTGGGFPGIPLAILFPETRFLLVDSIGKKIKVVADISSRIGLQNVKAVHSRAESIGTHDFDLAISRAVAPLATLWQWSQPALRRNENQGLICLKGGNLKDEIAASGLHPQIWAISDFFEESFFNEKYILWAQ